MSRNCRPTGLRWSRAAALRLHRRHHEVPELLSGSLWLWQALSFMMLARHTSTLFISGFRVTTMRLSRRFRVGGLLFGRRMAAHTGRHCPGRGLLRLPLHRRAVGRCSCVSIIAGPSVIRKLARHMTFASIISLIYDRYLRSCAGLLRLGAAASCCGGVLEVRVGCTSSQDTRHKLVASHLFGIILS